MTVPEDERRAGVLPEPGPGEPAERATSHDLRTVPLALAAWGSAWVGTLGDAQILVSTVIAALVALLVLPPLTRWQAGRVRSWLLSRAPRSSGGWAQRHHRAEPRTPDEAAGRAHPARHRAALLVSVAAVVTMSGSIGLLQANRLRSGPVADLAEQGAVVVAVLEVRGDARLLPERGSRPPLTLLRAQLHQVEGRGEAWAVRTPVQLRAGGNAAGPWSVLPVGTTVRVTARLTASEPGDDVGVVLQVRGPPEAARPPDGGLALVERVRQGLRDSVRERATDPRALVPALVLGDTSALTLELQDAFRATGLAHLTAVSGANLTLLLAFLLLAARWSGVRGWWLRGVGLCGVTVFVALCRTEPSVLRAAAMGLVALAALGSGSRRAGLRNLSVAMVLLLLADPYLARSWGFALSVLASAGIIAWAGPWADLLHRWMPRLVAEAVALPLAAQLATMPAVALLSGSVSASGLLANALAGPFVAPATVLGFAAAGASLVSGQLAAGLGFGAAWSAQVIIWVARAGAELPGAALSWPATPPGVGLLAAACLLTALLLPYILARRWACLLLALAMVLALLRVPLTPGWPPRGWRLVVCDVGQGDGIALRVAAREAVVVDSGPDAAAMRRCLDGLGVAHVPLLVLTHFHADHADGLAGVFTGGRSVGRVWVSPLASPPAQVAEALGLARQHGASVHTPAPGTTASVGAVWLTVLGPLPTVKGASEVPGSESESGAENDASLVVRAEVAGLRMLLTGDVEPAGQRALLRGGADLRVQVLKIPHHGSSRQEPAFFAATGATVAAASSGRDNEYGHPAPRTVALARSLGMHVLRTDQHGSVAVTWTNDRLAAVTQRPP